MQRAARLGAEHSFLTTWTIAIANLGTNTSRIGTCAARSMICVSIMMSGIGWLGPGDFPAGIPRASFAQARHRVDKGALVKRQRVKRQRVNRDRSELPATRAFYLLPTRSQCFLRSKLPLVL